MKCVKQVQILYQSKLLELKYSWGEEFGGGGDDNPGGDNPCEDNPGDDSPDDGDNSPYSLSPPSWAPVTGGAPETVAKIATVGAVALVAPEPASSVVGALIVGGLFLGAWALDKAKAKRNKKVTLCIITLQ